MRKIFLFFLFFVLFAGAYASSPVKENAIVIDLKSLKSVPEDNIRVLNKSNVDSYKFAVYGYSIKADDWLPINKYQKNEMSKSPQSCFISFDFEKYEVTHIAVGTDKGFISKFSTAVKADDLIITIESIDTSSSLKDDCEMIIAPINNEIKRIVSVPNVKRNVIYDSVLSACVDFFSNSKFAIEHKDKESGTIKGKATAKIDGIDTTYIFSFEIKDEKYRISINKDIGGADLKIFLGFEKDYGDKLDLIFNTYASALVFSENRLNRLVSLIDNRIKNYDW